MHIIIEGSDKVGKTTLAIELAKKLKLPIINRLKLRNTIYDECMAFLNNTDGNYIVDRFHISELAYGPVKRGMIRFTEQELKTIEDTCNEYKTFNIYCDGDITDIKERCDLLGESFIIGDEIDAVINNFRIEIARSNMKWLRYKIGDDIDAIAGKILKHFEKYNIEINENY